MILNAVDISDKQILEINSLLSTCEKYDDAKTCIQMYHFLNARKDLKSWILYYNNKELIGVVSIFAPLRNEAEISVCVNPKNRRKGIAKELLEIAHNNLKEFDINTILYVCNRNSKNGIEILKRKEFTLHHTEYTLKYIKQAKNNNSQRIIVRTAGENDIEIMTGILSNAFGSTYNEAKNFIESSIKSKTRKGYIAVKDNKSIGIAFVGYEKDISINTFGIIKSEQHKGYGKELLNSIISQIDYSNNDIVIDVDSNNMNAYKLYKKIGFEEILTIDYYQNRES
jgi:ribosomal protein S18 acetylase RimI-like enzyme